ncbi:unnamed protein product [Leptidea sinapis]|uniref:Uncharacterized protein n=1 Tax=Leptidea sinapis TaxID=189913 RepID=A0A5E4QIP0_9NEOP|nr:unnamed protein product [Leptidea sinapis]
MAVKNCLECKLLLPSTLHSEKQHSPLHILKFDNLGDLLATDSFTSAPVFGELLECVKALTTPIAD